MPRKKKSIVVETLVEEIHTEDIIKTIQIQNLYPAKVVVKGRVSGQPYVWSGAGAITDVREEDVEDLLARKIGNRACCGPNTSDGNILFRRL